MYVYDSTYFIGAFFIHGQYKNDHTLLTRSSKGNKNLTDQIVFPFNLKNKSWSLSLCILHKIFFQKNNKPMKYNVVRKFYFHSTPHKIYKKLFGEILLYIHCTKYYFQKYKILCGCAWNYSGARFIASIPDPNPVPSLSAWPAGNWLDDICGSHGSKILRLRFWSDH